MSWWKGEPPAMGFYLRKSVSLGPFRFNLSSSGIGVSAGIPGFRVGTGPRGNYVHLGRGGVYYRHTIPSSTPRAVPVSAPAADAAMHEIESASAAQIVDSSSEQLLAEIREKRRKLSATPFAFVAAVFFPYVATANDWPLWAFWIVVAICVFALVAASHHDRVAKTVVILYDLDARVEEAFRRFTEAADLAAASRRIWHVSASANVRDRKYHAGASAVVQRNPTSLRRVAPPFVKTNVPVVSIGAGRQTLYFLPDRLLVYDGASVGAVSYRTLSISNAPQRFIEEGGAPRDATVVDHTWRYVNRNGAPDRRFNNNPQLPVCLYDELTLQTPSGLNEVLQLSRAGAGEAFADAVRGLGA
ncbi:MAG TPA: DUF4236 domain-containing protein, partial [Thermoanaerobaculia bacterium]|nr:DUF4236 domain-containing protein [Thermoanaerobaculia bacterium]